MGKGDTRRPAQVPEEHTEAEWARIFPQNRGPRPSRCSRCNCALIVTDGQPMTSGYYHISLGCWDTFANPGDVYICDACMWADPRYIAVYGVHLPPAVEDATGTP